MKNNEYLKYIDYANTAILKSKKNFLEIERTAVKLKYAYITSNKTFTKEGKIINDGFNVEFRHTKTAVEFFRNNYTFDADKISKLTFNPESGASILVIGLYILMVTKLELNLSKVDMRLLKAYHPSSNIEFHKQSCASVSTSKICIYETFRDVIGKSPLKYSRRENKEYREKLYKDLKDEGVEIEASVKDGNLVTSLELLTKKYKNEVLIVFFGSQLSIEGEKIIINGDRPIYISNGEMKECKDTDIKGFMDSSS